MSFMWSEDQRFAPAPDVVTRVLDGEAVVLDLAAERYFGLNSVGTRIWELASAGKTFAEIRAAIVDEFDVDAEAAGRDVGELLTTLAEKQLIRQLP